MPSKIILSYRRSDSDVITGRIRDKLASYYGDDAVFMDIDSISLGFDYRKQIKDALLQNKIFIAIIGPKWLGTKGTETRIKEENDPVRIEVETALQQGIPVIPVLVGGATMPNAAELPSSLQNLCYFNAAQVDGGRDFHQHMGRLIKGIDQILNTGEAPPAEKVPITRQASSTKLTPKQRRKWIPVALGAFACLLLISIGIWAYPSISLYIKSKMLTQVVVNPTPTPTPPPPPAPPPPAIPPPPFSSAACKPESASFYDDFHKPDPGWNLIIGDSQYYAEGQLILKPNPTEAFLVKYLSLRYENATICAHIKSPPQLKALDADANGGVVFWATDNDHYVANIWPDGTYAILRKFNGEYSYLVPRTKNEQIKSGINAVNEVRVVLVDNFGALFINNVKVQEFRGQPPKGGGAVGLRAQSEPTGSDEWRFLDIAVMDNGKSKPVVLPPAPSGPTIADCRPTNSTDFQDTFAKPNPEWSDAQYADGQLLLIPKAHETKSLLYRTLVFKNATLCLTVKSPPEITDLEGGSSAGLLFWASDYQNFYYAAIFPNGTFLVYRLFNNAWATIIPRTMSDTIKKGIGAVNELQVVLSNNNGSLYINGIQVQTFRGQPPKEGGAVGVFAQSGGEQQSAWRFFNITVVENQ
jgi:TIR domain